MQINGKEIDFRISSVKHAGAMKLALDNMSDTEEKIKSMKEKDLTSVLTAGIGMFQDFFKTATGEDILADCDDLQEARDTYEQFLSEIEKQKKAVLAPYSVKRIK